MSRDAVSVLLEQVADLAKRVAKLEAAQSPRADLMVTPSSQCAACGIYLSQHIGYQCGSLYCPHKLSG